MTALGVCAILTSDEASTPSEINIPGVKKIVQGSIRNTPVDRGKDTHTLSSLVYSRLDAEIQGLLLSGIIYAVGDALVPMIHDPIPLMATTSSLPQYHHKL